MKLNPWIPAIIWAVVIFILSVLPGKDLPDISIDYFDKIAHSAVYAILALLIWKALIAKRSFMSFAAIFLVPTVYGILIEFFQGIFLNDRITDVYDMIANAIGALIVIIYIQVFIR